MLVECSYCGAPLDVKEGKTVYKCNYCGQKNVQQQMRMLAQVTPNTWQAPKVWTPPAHVATAGKTFKYRRQALGLTVLMPVLLGVLMPMIIAFFATGGGNWVRVATWDERSTLSCAPNGELEIKGVNAKVKDGPVIEMSANCTVTLIDSTIAGPIGIKGGANAHIKIVNSTIKAEEVGIEGGANADIKVMGKSKVSGKVAGISGEGNAKIELKRATVSGEETGIDGGANGKITMRSKSKIEGDDVALRLGTNGDVDIRDSKIVSDDGTAIEGGINNEVQCRGGSIKGKQALKFTQNADLRLGKCKVSGPQDLGRGAKKK